MALGAASAPGTLVAQQVDSARVGVGPRRELPGVLPRDTVPPLSPRRAFVTSLLLPGYAQARLDRPLGAAFFGAVEAGALVMLVKSVHDLRLAKRYARDSLIVGVQRDASGAPILDPETQEPLLEYSAPLADPELVRARRLHLEDWIFVLAFNHVIAAADAFVSAQLWDVPAALQAEVAPGRAMVGAAVRW